MTPPTTESKTILVVDDDPAMHKACASILEPRGYRMIGAASGQEALAALQRDPSQSIGFVIADIRMPGMDGIALLKAIRSYDSTVPVIIMTGYGSVDSAVEAMKLGAMDYITKPFEKNQILKAVNQGFALQRLRTQVRRREREGQRGAAPGGFLGESSAAEGIRELIDIAARNKCNILITGPSGTGKELVARSIHRKSSRAQRSFVPINCAAIPANLMESEFFGHTKGAFTGAERTTDGLYHKADKGILFLDEISEMPAEMQVKLLRVIEDGKVRRVGSTDETGVDVQIIAATNRNIRAALREASLRTDLFYRLSVLTINIPPLCERQEDIPLFVQYFVDSFNEVGDHRITAVDHKAMDHLTRYRWPGNVRELQNVIQSIFVRADAPRIRVIDLPRHIARSSRSDLAPGAELDAAEVPTLRQVEAEHIRWVLKKAGGNRTRAAELLGISRSALYNKLDEFGIT